MLCILSRVSLADDESTPIALKVVSSDCGIVLLELNGLLASPMLPTIYIIITKSWMRILLATVSIGWHIITISYI
jgi:hypothetical protein